MAEEIVDSAEQAASVDSPETLDPIQRLNAVLESETEQPGGEEESEDQEESQDSDSVDQEFEQDADESEAVEEVEEDDPTDDSEEETVAEQKLFHLNNIKERKQRVLIANEMAKLAFEENLIDLAFDAATLATKDEWDPIKDHDLIMAQSESHNILAKCYVEFLLEEEIEIGHKELVTLEDDQDERDFTNEDKAKFHEQKIKFTEHIIKAIKLGSQSS